MHLTKTFIASAAAAVLAIVSLPSADAHSWIDCIDTDRSKVYDQSQEYIFGGAKGNGFCSGYAAGYPGRGDGDIGTTFTHKMLKNEVEAGAKVCQSVDGNTYSGWRKRISVDAGVPIYFSYLPNGHVVKDKMGRGTKHGIYWSGKPGTALSTTKDMTSDHLVDGKLMDFDDGTCGETVETSGAPSGRAGDGKPCVGSFTIPAGTAPGVYDFVWYWTFYLDDNSYVDPSVAKGYFGAAYSSCFQVEVTGSGGGDYAAPTEAPAPTPKPTSAPAPEPEPTPAPTPAPEPTMAPTAKPETKAPAPEGDGNGGVNPPDYSSPKPDTPVTPAPTTMVPARDNTSYCHE